METQVNIFLVRVLLLYLVLTGILSGLYLAALKPMHAAVFIIKTNKTKFSQ
jgi:hypothetical protein